MERPTFRLPPNVKFTLPVGALLDIPTGIYLTGMHDQRVLLGGIGSVTGIVGPGNSFKSTIMNYMQLSALSKIIQVAPETWVISYDTEINMHEDRNFKLSQNFEALKGRDILEEGIWQITDKTVYMGNEWFAETKKHLYEKKDDKKAYAYETAFLSRDTTTPLFVMLPTFSTIDSLSQFITSDVEKMMDSTELGESAGNMINMRQGLAKSRMLMEIPTLAGASYNFFLFTAHIGKDAAIPSGPMAAPPRKQLQHMPQGEVIKGVSNNFFYLLHNCWLVNNARPFLNQGTKGPEYPFEPGDEVSGDLDLFIVNMRQLRGKNGQSGLTIELLVSQNEGVLASLSEYHYLKTHERFGLESNVQSHALYLLPEVKLSRTTIRKKIREDKRVVRALEITSQLAQIAEYHRELRDKLVGPQELRAKLEEQGYDWNWLLLNTRSWNTINDEIHPGYPFSTLDLCRAARGEYTPYWINPDKKTVNPKYAAKKLNASTSAGATDASPKKPSKKAT